MEKKIEIKLEGKAAVAFDKWYLNYQKNVNANKQRILEEYLTKINQKKRTVA